MAKPSKTVIIKNIQHKSDAIFAALRKLIGHELDDVIGVNIVYIGRQIPIKEE